MGNKIYIIGAGAVGKALAVFLKLSGRDVCLIRGSVDNVPTKTEAITVQMPDETTLTADIKVSSFSEHPAFDGILVVTAKSFGNQNLAETLRSRAKSTPVVLLQNGLGVDKPFVEHEFAEVYRCVLFTTCQLTDENTVRFKPVAPSPIGIIKGTSETLQQIVSQLDNSAFRFRGEENLQPVIWKKAIANCVFNSVCPLLDIDNGIFHRNEAAKQLAGEIISECVNIARLSGVGVTEQEVMESVLMISKMSDGQMISTLQDINNQRKTEIETLNFAIADIARTLGREHEVPKTKLLGELTRLKSDLNVSPA